MKYETIISNAFSILHNYNVYILISCRKFNGTLDTELLIFTLVKNITVLLELCPANGFILQAGFHSYCNFSVTFKCVCLVLV